MRNRAARAGMVLSGLLATGAIIAGCSDSGGGEAQTIPNTEPSTIPGQVIDTQDAVTACPGLDLSDQQPIMDEYIDSPEGFRIRTDVEGGQPSAVAITIPPFELGEEGTSPTLAVGPCQHIYRFAFNDVPDGEGGVQGPFRFSEVDWNTEGIPRGPNGTFAYPHFDFHFYTKPREFIRSLTCEPLPPTDRVCDPLATGFQRMREFQNIVPPGFVPASYRADVGSAIPQMGLHYLDSAFDYTLDDVNSTPTRIYGSYDGEVVFLEASVTLFTLRDVKDDPNNEIVWPVKQPQKVAGPTSWPTQFRLRYLPDSGGFEAAFIGFEPLA